ncbi:beta-ketoacyl-ACP synthase II [Acuticoccus yangtzensis]|uniref:beta-ketoacyl-ACP synthase II n=1 Tax=Acuticoccus yangtzensis TaxID=1443441 RepID=UPI0009496657|nr:beta-ketoacyl-ACP synthase II [Acuticoccus yangtzensis]ORE96376.1 3-oxoacyl-(acyl-carrier-protein) synthase 2 [Stappia sp. 22II-S9-Z10]
MRRVVVTGLGTVNPMGNGIEASWEKIVAGKSGASAITKFKTDDLPSKIACQVPRGTGPGEFDPSQTMDAKDQRKFDEFIVFASAAADEAIADSGWKPTEEEDRDRTGVLIGSGIGGLNLIDVCSTQLEEKGPRRISPFFIPGALINMASGVVSIRYGFRGPNHAVVTACSTGAHAIGDAARMIALDDADVMVAGGTEATVNRLALAGFAACRALSTSFNDDPTSASRPYDKDRDGFVIGEGAGVVVLEEYEHAKKRGAKIYGEVIGYGLSGDAHHITAPAADGNGGYRSMMAALKRAKIAPGEIDYVNAHGTSTPLGDEIELNAVTRVMGNDIGGLTMSSTKSATGHLLGAAGAMEAIFCLLAMRDQVAPPTINLDNPSVDTAIDLVPHTAKEKKIDVVLSNSFGFGGTNASLVFRRV